MNVSDVIISSVLYTEGSRMNSIRILCSSVCVVLFSRSGFLRWFAVMSNLCEMFPWYPFWIARYFLGAGSGNDCTAWILDASSRVSVGALVLWCMRYMMSPLRIHLFSRILLRMKSCNWCFLCCRFAFLCHLMCRRSNHPFRIAPFWTDLFCVGYLLSSFLTFLWFWFQNHFS